MLDKELRELIESRLNRAKEILGYIPGYIDMGDYNGAKYFVSEVEKYLSDKI